MLTGEFDYEDNLEKNRIFLTYLMFFLFLFIGAVFLMNLLVGLAVSDTTTAMEKAARTRLRLQIETINHVELMMGESLRRKLWKGFRQIEDDSRPTVCQIISMQKISHWCRWLGLPKTAIKRDFSEKVS